MITKRHIFIGDVHGCLDELKQLLGKMDYNPDSDQVCLVGDLVDRGPDSAGVVKYARMMGFDCVKGNHDDKYVRYRKHFTKMLNNHKYTIPMKMSDEQLNIFKSLDDADFFWLDSLPTYIDYPNLNLVVVHAGVLPGRDIKTQSPGVHMYTRYLNKDTNKQVQVNKDFSQPDNSVDWSLVYDGKKDIVYGHQVNSFTDVKVSTNANGARAIGIDTGACFGGNLTAFTFNLDGTNSIFQVRSSRNYSGTVFVITANVKDNGN